MDYEAPLIAEPQSKAEAAVIWLHGLGADGNDFLPIVPHLRIAREHIRFVFPHAPMIPVTINQGLVMRAWYDLAEESGQIISNEQHQLASQSYLESLIHEQHGLGLAYDRIILAGFSQGGAIILQTGLRFPHRLGGLMALSTYLPGAERLKEERSHANADTSIFMAHGSDDPMISIDRAITSCDKLLELDYPVEWKTYRMDHAVCPEEIADIDDWLGRAIPHLTGQP